jgi:hypothetical protein
MSDKTETCIESRIYSPDLEERVSLRAVYRSGRIDIVESVFNERCRVGLGDGVTVRALVEDCPTYGHSARYLLECIARHKYPTYR